MSKADEPEAVLGSECIDASRIVPVDPAAWSCPGDGHEQLGTEVLQQTSTAHAEALDGMTATELTSLHDLPYLPGPEFDVGNALYRETFTRAFDLTPRALETLDSLGFVVVPLESATEGPTNVYAKVFMWHLPVLITADSILHAWHVSFDEILELTETRVLMPLLLKMLTNTAHFLDDTSEAGANAKLYVAVAARLLGVSLSLPPSIAGDLELLVDAIERGGMATVYYMGGTREMDFTQLEPRGHYTESEELQRYFRAMMWLGRTDLVLYDHDSARIHPHEEAAARALVEAMASGPAMGYHATFERFLSTLIGDSNAMGPQDLVDLCAETGCSAEAYASVPLSAYSSMPPSSLSLRMVPQRFAYDAWVLDQVTTPRLQPDLPGCRSMPMAEDVAFALGSSRAVSWMQEELQKPCRENLPATLQAIHLTLDDIAPTALGDSVYNHWLEGLVALSNPTLDESYPDVMRTAAWHDHRMETVLSSWAELRHDTILYVEQSYGSISCLYPAGYVEPVPCLYRSLAEAARSLSSLYEVVDFSEDVTAFLQHWQDVMARLEEMSLRQLDGQSTSCEGIEFLNSALFTPGDKGCGSPYDGWYPLLYWTSNWPPVDTDHPSEEHDPIVADVHTDLQYGNVLEVATGDQGVLIFAIEQYGEVLLYGGPVGSFYSFAHPMADRLTDERWREMLYSGSALPRPEFTESYRVD